MIPVFQTLFVKDHGIGNCFNACVASLMEIPIEACNDILPGQGGKHWYRRWQGWFEERGVYLSVASVLDPPSGYTIASVLTERYFPSSHPRAGERIGHACVALDGRIVHDPYPYSTGSLFISYYYLISQFNPDD